MGPKKPSTRSSTTKGQTSLKNFFLFNGFDLEDQYLTENTQEEDAIQTNLSIHKTQKTPKFGKLSPRKIVTYGKKSPGNSKEKNSNTKNSLEKYQSTSKTPSKNPENDPKIITTPDSSTPILDSSSRKKLKQILTTKKIQIPKNTSGTDNVRSPDTMDTPNSQNHHTIKTRSSEKKELEKPPGISTEKKYSNTRKKLFTDKSNNNQKIKSSQAAHNNLDDKNLSPETQEKEIITLPDIYKESMLEISPKNPQSVWVEIKTKNINGDDSSDLIPKYEDKLSNNTDMKCLPVNNTPNNKLPANNNEKNVRGNKYETDPYYDLSDSSMESAIEMKSESDEDGHDDILNTTTSILKLKKIDKVYESTLSNNNFSTSSSDSDSDNDNVFEAIPKSRIDLYRTSREKGLPSVPTITNTLPKNSNKLSAQKALSNILKSHKKRRKQLDIFAKLNDDKDSSGSESDKSENSNNSNLEKSRSNKKNEIVGLIDQNSFTKLKELLSKENVELEDNFEKLNKVNSEYVEPLTSRKGLNNKSERLDLLDIEISKLYFKQNVETKNFIFETLAYDDFVNYSDHKQSLSDGDLESMLLFVISRGSFCSGFEELQNNIDYLLKNVENALEIHTLKFYEVPRTFDDGTEQ
ncbi:hypothetical protein BB558_001745 [Smittium angustum]|uniref:Uncharacterized protein n=1 Tax=Smittium angustum TaxID=133377 RepID=A0A2U1JAG5_SMIAN|nr:hypothetical protein BB558_001745 [Smittium angustum]